MTTFQWLALAILGMLVIRSAIGLFRDFTGRRQALVSMLVWLAAAGAIARPNLVQAMAGAIGIGRGADVVLYLFVLGSLATTFYFYSRYVALQRQVTQIIRHLAIHEAELLPSKNSPNTSSAPGT
ncbi:MAG: DUF2304 domain-containing protein [Planctomycetota bacterium]